MSKLAVEYLKHIRDELDYITVNSQTLTFQKFSNDETLKRSFTRSIEIIGEATKNLPADFRKLHDHIDWKSIAGMRDRLIYDYFGIDYEIVWDVITNEVPKLKKEIENILQETGS